MVPDVTRELPYMLGTPSSQRELKENIDAIHYEDRSYILQQRINNGEFSSAEDVSAAGYELEFNMQYRTNRLVDAYYQELNEYQNRARMSARISPMTLFRNAAEAVTATGTARYRRFLGSLHSYSAVYDAYFIQKTGRLTPRIEFGQDTVVDFKGTIIRQRWMPNYADVDISDFPVFTFTPPSLADSIADGAVDLAGLAVWNLILAIAVCAAFLRMDVRRVY